MVETDDPEWKITELTRRDVVDMLLLHGEPGSWTGRLDLMTFLNRVWPLKSMSSHDPRFKNAEGDIWQHTVNNEDYTYPQLLYDRLDLLNEPDQVFARFVEAVVHPLVRPQIEEAEELVRSMNEYLQHDGFALRPVGQISGRRIFRLRSTTGSEGLNDAYEIVLSFAGENREYVEQVAEILRAEGVGVFYDAYEEATLWGKDLHEHLHQVYSGSARFCVMFISQAYAEKVWPSHERRSAFEKAMETKQEYILPARFDDTTIPGLHKTIGYIDLRRKTPEQIANLIFEKLGRTRRRKSRTDHQ